VISAYYLQAIEMACVAPWYGGTGSQVFSDS
jgi:hypothetical protein